MSAGTIEHRAVVQRIDGGMVTIAMNLASCASCSEGGACGIGKMASGRAATLLTLPAGGPLRVGDEVIVALPESRLTLAALFGYLFPAAAMLLGAAAGATVDGSDGAAALGAVGGFLAALAIGRLAIGRTPGLIPAPKLIRLVHQAGLSRHFAQEFDHER